MALNPKLMAEEAAYRFDRIIHKTQGLLAKLSLRTLMGSGAATVATKLSGPFREALGWKALVAEAPLTTGQLLGAASGGLATAGIGWGVDAYLNHMEFRHEEKKLCELYRPQIASIMGKERGLVNVQDLYSVADSNPSLMEELDRVRSTRNIKTIASGIGTVAAFAAVFAAIALGPLGAPAAAVAMSSIVSVAGAKLLIGAGLLGIGTMMAARKITTKVGEKIRGLDEPSTEQVVASIGKERRKDHLIQPEQVMGVYAVAHPALGANIAESFGKPYHKLSAAEQGLAAEQFGSDLNLARTAVMINEGEMNVRELMFKVHGQHSGVYPEAPLHERLKDMAGEKLDPLQNKIEDLRVDALQKVEEWREKRRESEHQDQVAKAVEEGRSLPTHPDDAKPSWRERLGFSRDKVQEQGASGPSL